MIPATDVLMDLIKKEMKDKFSHENENEVKSAVTALLESIAKNPSMTEDDMKLPLDGLVRCATKNLEKKAEKSLKKLILRVIANPTLKRVGHPTESVIGEKVTGFIGDREKIIFNFLDCNDDRYSRCKY